MEKNTSELIQAMRFRNRCLCDVKDRIARALWHRHSCLCRHTSPTPISQAGVTVLPWQMSHFSLDPPLGFEGLDRRRAIHLYRRNLPHWRQEGATYFLTYRLADALPREALSRLTALKRDRKPETEEDWEQLSKEVAKEEEHWLDQGSGECLLRNPEISAVVEEKFRSFDGTRYQLGAFVVMPNHVHVLVRPFPGHPLDRITKAWKGVSARAINSMVSRKAQTLWQDESYDAIVRDEEHLFRIVRYIGNNPAKAKLSSGFVRWVSPMWEAAGYGFETDDRE